MYVTGINQVNYNYSKPAFRGKLISTPALEKFEAGLNTSGKKTFEQYKKIIESVDDGREFVYKYMCDNPSLGFAGIHYGKCEQTCKETPILFDKISNSLSMFKELADMTTYSGVK
jgi:hypothetical protein